MTAADPEGSMKGIVYEKYGLPEVLEFRDIPTPAPKPHEVLVRVNASSINAWDWDLLRGTPFINRIGAFRTPRHKILGADIAGTVEAVGRKVVDLQPGDEVMGDISGSGWGGFAEYVCAKESALTLKPPSLSFEEAAAIPQAGVLALQGLRYKGQIHAGQRVLINGAGGGAGTFAVQIAKSIGAHVTGVDSKPKLHLVSSIGADETIDYTTTDFTAIGAEFDFIFDAAACHSLSDYKQLLKPGGTCVIVGGTTSLLVRTAVLGPVISRLGSRNIGLLAHKPNQADIAIVNGFVTTGKVVPIIDRHYTLSELPEALRYFGDGQAQGKIVINI